MDDVNINSHFWSSLEMLEKWVILQKYNNLTKEEILNYLEIGLDNTKYKGFELKCNFNPNNY